MHRLHHSLAEKGWTKKEIDHAVHVLEHARSKKHATIQFFDHSVFVLAILLSAFGNVIVALALIPLFLVFNSSFLYIIVIILGVAFGLLFEILIRTLEHLEKHHHLFLATLIPVMALATFVIIFSFSGTIENMIGIPLQQSPWIIGSLYTISFMLPYLLYQTSKPKV